MRHAPTDLKKIRKVFDEVGIYYLVTTDANMEFVDGKLTNYLDVNRMGDNY